MTIIMLFSAVVPALASTDNNMASVTAPTSEPEKSAIISGKLDGGVYTLNINAEALYEILKDKRISKDELLQFIPEEALNALKDKNAREAIAELAANFITAEDLSELLALIPTDVLLDYVDIAFIEKFITVDELLSIIPLDSILEGVPEKKIESLITSEVFKLLLNENIKNKVLTNSFISDLLENSKIVDEIVSDTAIHDDLASLIDGPIVDKILANKQAKANLIALAESQAVLDAVIGNPEVLHAVQEYLFNHTEKINTFLSDTNVIIPLRNSSVIRAHVAQLIDPHYLLEEISVNYEDLAQTFGITEQYIKDNADRLGLSYDEAQNFTSLEDLIKNDNVNLEFLCADKDITVEKLIYLGYVSDAELSHIISDNWGNVVNDESFAKDIINVVGIHAIFEDFGRDDIIRDVFGGYYGMIQKDLVSESDVVTAVGGYNALVDYLLPEKLDDIINIVGMEKWKEYVDINDIVDMAGGYSALLSMYPTDELQAIVNAIGMGNIKNFLLDIGIKDKINIKGIVKDFIILIKDKGYFIKEIFNLITRILNNEFSTISLNDTVIYKNGSFFLQKIFYAIISEMPDIEDIVEMNSGDTLIGFVISAPVRGETISLGVEIKLVGDLTDLQSFLEAYKDDFKFDVSENMDISLTVGLPSILSDLYEKALLSDKIPDTLKTKLLELPTMTVADVANLINNITDDELEKLASTFAEKADSIRDKVYAKIDEKAGDIEAVAKAKAAADKIIDTVSNPDKLSSLKDKVYGKLIVISNVAGSKNFFSYYNGNGSISVNQPFSFDLYEIINRVITIPDDILVLFDNDMTVSGNVTTTVNTDGIYKVTVIEPDGTVKEFLLPEGMDLGILNDHGLVDTDLSGKTVPGEDSVISHEDIYRICFLDGNGNILHDAYYTLSTPPNTSLFPTVPAIEGYNGQWSDYVLYSEKEIAVTPVYTPIEYDFGYSVDGVYTYVEKITVKTDKFTLPDNITCDDGYEFIGWYIDLNGNGEMDKDEFYLVKTAKNTYKAPTGKIIPLGDVVAVADIDEKVYKATLTSVGEHFRTVEFTISNRQFPLITARPDNPWGWTFDGWFCDLDGDGYYETEVTYGYELPLRDISIVALFNENFYNVYIKANGQTTLMPDPISVTSEFVYLNIPEKQYYDFSKYYYESDTSVVLTKTDEFKEVAGVKYYKFKLPNNFSFPDRAVYFVAEYTPTEYTVTLDHLNGTKTEIKYNCQSATVTIPDFTPVPDGKIFKGWFVDLDGDGIYERQITSSDGGTFSSVFGNVTAIPVFTDKTFNANFEAIDSFTGATVVFTYGDSSLDPNLIPAVPVRDGFDGQWYVRTDNGNDIPLASYTLENKDITIYAKYERNRFKVTFTVDGYTHAEVEFNKGETKLPDNKIPDVPTKIGYNGYWYVTDASGADILFSSYTLENKDITVYARYDKIIVPPQKTFTVTFVANGIVVESFTCPFGTAHIHPLLIPSVPSKIGYIGEWESYTLNDRDITVNAIYSPIEYKATFKADGKVVGEVTFTVEDKILSRIPEVPAKAGYIGSWPAYTISAKDMEINAVYTLKIFKATFIADNKVVAIIDFTVNDTSITEPEVPYREGYIGEWEKYTLGTTDIVVTAVYSPIEDITPVPTPSDNLPKGEEKKENKFIFWWIFLLAGIILLIVWIIIKIKDKDDDDNKPEPPTTPKEPEAAPPVVPVGPAEEEPEQIETVEAVDVETADILMTDEVAMAVVETVGGAGVGMKSIVNLCDINRAFSDGDTVDIDSLKAKKLVSAKTQRVKILADGTLDKAITVYAEQFSVQAIKMITLTGGKAIQKK